MKRARSRDAGPAQKRSRGGNDGGDKSRSRASGSGHGRARSNKGKGTGKGKGRGKERRSNVSWRSKVVCVHDGEKYYEAVRIGDEEFKVGDFVSVLVLDAAGKETESPAVLESMWSSNGPAKGPMCEVRWFVDPQETRAGVGDESEVFESDKVDECSIDAINGHARIVSEEDFWERTRDQPLIGDDDDDEDDDASASDESDGSDAEESDASSKTGRKHSKRSKLLFCKDFFAEELEIIRPSTLFTQKRQTYAYSKRLRGVNLTASKLGDSEADKFSRAFQQLQLSATPPSLPCRDAERDTIHTFLRDAIAGGGAGGALYISGMPGTGKTATVHEVVRSLQREARNGSLADFDFVEINGMRLPHPYQAYTELHKALTGQNASQTRAAQLLEQRFAGSSTRASSAQASSTTDSPRTCVLLVDELDYMVTRKQTVLYNLFDWPTRPNVHLVVVGIANTMDLPERLLPRIASRLGMSRVVFQSYTRDQLERIIRARLEGLDIFEQDAVQMSARKVASLSGDVRRALQICRRAAEICQRDHMAQRGLASSSTSSMVPGASLSSSDAAAGSSSQQQDPLVSIAHVNQAAKELSDNLLLRALQNASSATKLLFVALFKHLSIHGADEASLSAIAPRFHDLWRQHCIHTQQKHEPLSRHQVVHLCQRVAASRLLKARQAPDERDPVIRPGLELDDIPYVLARDAVCQPFLQTV
ncbi:Origin recognition complex subunit 1 [Hondaea fermentalgiana]|uniref:Origin recognition complex subunit 1 n=1 Tax=Hondaea fermentalgiana TaxID=2315210 RepID=A0A2R5GRB9_9STRA|nr:Origin recognition complex subunit 1 [Hondaea fermentalgiana]|eukprot:GBG30424.1 Origin recognition complex subunit 1 [Hondaea fermentalgiana]